MNTAEQSPPANSSRLPPSSSSSSPSSSSSISASRTYTSLKDVLLPSSLSLPPPAPISAAATSAASIRNPLLKRAAWAYLQPMESTPSASGRHLFSYFSGDFIKPFLSSIKRAIADWAARASNWFSDALWLLLCR